MPGIKAGEVLVERPFGLGGRTVVHAPNPNEAGKAACGKSGRNFVRREPHQPPDDAISCGSCELRIGRAKKRRAVADGGQARVGRARPAATVETTVPGISEPVELTPLQLGAVVGGVALAGGLVGAALAGR